MRKIFFATAFALLSASYSFRWGSNREAWGAVSNPFKWEYETKPFVYRALVPTVSDIFNISVEYIVLIFCVGLGLVMLGLRDKYWGKSLRNDIALVLAFSLVISSVEYYKKIYDIPTAFFFTLLIYLWSEKKYLISMPVFLLSSLNRETTAILIPVFLILHRDIFTTFAYSVSWGFARFVTTTAYADNAGNSIYIRPLENAMNYLESPVGLLVLITVATAILIMFFSNKPKSSGYVSLLFPVLLGMHVVAGAPFETRVFAEIMPVLFMGAFLIPN